MPELPEVETVVRSLQPHVVGRQIVAVEVRHPKSFPDVKSEHRILRQSIVAVRRRAKLIIIEFDNGWYLVAHLKMTGQLLYRGETLAGGGHPTADVLAQLPGTHTRVIMDLSDGAHLYFNDLRIFGWLRVVDGLGLQEMLTPYGPDATELDAETLAAAAGRRRVPIKQVLMDNKVTAGIGNIYAAEILHASHVDPRRPAQSLTREELTLICEQARDILARAIESGGTTFDGRYVDANGQRGNFEEKLQVYGRAGQACHGCGHQLQSVKIGGRSTVFCPECQR